MIMMMIVFTSFIVKKAYDDYGLLTAILSGIMMCLNILLIVLGNPWIWAGWTLFRTVRYIFFPREIDEERRETMPPVVFMLSTMLSVSISACTFVVFQYIR